MRTLVLAAFSVMVSGAAQAAEPRSFSDHRALNANAKLSVRNLAGVIEVEGWDRAEFDLSAQLGESAEQIEITGSAADLQVEVKNRKVNYTYGDGDTRMKLKVPAGVVLSLDGTSADIVVRGTKGALTARSVSGDVDLMVSATEVSAQTVSGDLRLEAPLSKQTRLNTVSGDTDVKAATGLLSAESVSGDVQVKGTSFTQLDLKSVSGDVGVKASFAADAKVKAESLSGDVLINAPASLSAEVSLKTFSGDRNSDFDAVREASEGKRALLKIGEGRGQFSLTSFSGDVTLDRQ